MLASRVATASASASALLRSASSCLVTSERLVLPGREKDVLAILRDLSGAAKATPGFVAARSFVDADNSSRVVVVSEWESVAAWRKWVEAPERGKQLDALRAHLFGPVTHRVLAPHRDASSGPVLV